VNNRVQQENQDESVWISNATEKRKMSMLAHLSKLLRSGQTYLNEGVPHRVEINRIRMVIIDEEFENENENMESAAKLDLFNGNLIYLCNDSQENSILECHGVGLVRAIDKIHGYMYILLPQELNLSIINVIAIANIPLPSDTLLKQNFNTVDGSVPFVTFFKNRGAKKYMNKRQIKDCY
jgi:polynucleotide 5'-hydroxyl-kinase GRC3/NOL9